MSDSLPENSGHWADDIQSWSHDDGTEVYLFEDHRAPLVSISINFPVHNLMAWTVENDGEIAFSGQSLDSNQELRRKRESLGVSLFSYMGDGFATIQASSLESHFEELIALIGETLSNRNYDKKELRAWHRNRILGWRATSKNPRTQLFKTALQSLYTDPNDPIRQFYDKPRKHSTDSRKLSEARDRIISVPGRTVAVAGQINRNAVEESLGNLLPEASSESIPFESYPEPTRFASGTEYRVPQEKLNQVYMALFRGGQQIYSEDYSKHLVVNQILGGTFSSRLVEKLRHEGGDTYSANLVQLLTRRRPGMVALETFTRADNELLVEEKLRLVLADIHRDGVTKEEVDAALAYLKGRQVFAQETPEAIVNQWAANRVFELPGNVHELTLEQASRLSVDEINAFIGDFYNPDLFALAKVVPKDG